MNKLVKSLMVGMIMFPVFASANTEMVVGSDTVTVSSEDDGLCAFQVFIDNIAYESSADVKDGMCIQVVDYPPMVAQIKADLKGKTEVSVNGDMVVLK